MPKSVSGKPDHELARSAANGDRAAFDSIVRRYGRALTDFAANKTTTVQDAEDIVQETFIRAFVNIKTFDPRFSLKNWLFTIAYRLIVSSYRKKRPKQLDSRLCNAMIDPRSDDAPMDWLWKLTESMGRDTHTILWLRYKQQMEISEIARIMNKSKISVRVLLHRARRKLADRISAPTADEAADHCTYRQGVLLERTNQL